jgi:opacity protein-like surface antigen
MRNLCALAALLCLSCVLSAAQTNFDEWKIYGGYQYTSLDTHAVQDALNLQHALDPTFPLLNFGRHQGLNGWDVGGEEDVVKWFGLVIDISGTYGSNNLPLSSASTIATELRTKMQLYTFTGGPQFTLRRSSRVQPFARALLGGGWESVSINLLENNVPQLAELKSKDSGFAYGGGGGVDFFFSRKIGLRVAADYIRTPFFNDTQNNFRGTAGLVFRFGK